MNPQLPAAEAVATPTQPGAAVNARGWRRACWGLAAFVAVLSLCFARPLLDMARYVTKSELYSHVPLIPIISAGLIWMRRHELAALAPGGRAWAVVPGLTGALALAGYGLARLNGVNLVREDYLALTLGAFVCWMVAGAIAIWGARRLRQVAFPMALLVFMVPFPVGVLQGLEVFFQHTTAWVTHGMFLLSGTPVLRVGTSFQLPGFALRVAEECSGIRSSLVLLITSLLAGYWFLRTGWKRWVLALAVIPLGIVRNAFRVFTISMLCIHVDLQMIDSPLHRRGGPLFFLLSLVPLFLLLVWLRRTETKSSPPPGSAQVGASATGMRPGRT